MITVSDTIWRPEIFAMLLCKFLKNKDNYFNKEEYKQFNNTIVYPMDKMWEKCPEGDKDFWLNVIITVKEFNGEIMGYEYTRS